MTYIILISIRGTQCCYYFLLLHNCSFPFHSRPCACTYSYTMSGCVAILMVYWWTTEEWVEAEEERRASRCTSVPYSWTSTTKLFIQHTSDLPCLFAQQGACVPSVHHWVHERVSKWASESYLSVRSHHGIVGIVGGRLCVRGRLRPWWTLVKQKERCQSCYANMLSDIQTFLWKKWVMI